MSHALWSQSCRRNCVTAKRAASRKIVPQITSVQTGGVVPEVTAKFLAPDPDPSWFLDSSPPRLLSALAASFSILRI